MQVATHNSYHAAVMEKLNALAARYGLKPYHYEAITFTSDGPLNTVTQVIRFTTVPADEYTASFSRMLRDLGATNAALGPELSGTSEALYTRLEEAIKRAPQIRGRT